MQARKSYRKLWEHFYPLWTSESRQSVFGVKLEVSSKFFVTPSPALSVLGMEYDKCHGPFTPFRVSTCDDAHFQDVRMRGQLCRGDES